MLGVWDEVLFATDAQREAVLFEGTPAVRVIASTYCHTGEVLVSVDENSYLWRHKFHPSLNQLLWAFATVETLQYFPPGLLQIVASYAPTVEITRLKLPGSHKIVALADNPCDDSDGSILVTTRDDIFTLSVNSSAWEGDFRSCWEPDAKTGKLKHICIKLVAGAQMKSKIQHLLPRGWMLNQLDFLSAAVDRTGTMFISYTLRLIRHILGTMEVTYGHAVLPHGTALEFQNRSNRSPMPTMHLSLDSMPFQFYATCGHVHGTSRSDRPSHLCCDSGHPFVSERKPGAIHVENSIDSVNSVYTAPLNFPPIHGAFLSRRKFFYLLSMHKDDDSAMILRDPSCTAIDLPTAETIAIDTVHHTLFVISSSRIRRYFLVVRAVH